MNLRPIGDKVIVEILKAEDKTKGGIILPDTAKEKPQEAKVIAVGSGKTLDNGKVVAPDLRKIFRK
jgi:chaperonin GroES